MVRDRYRNKYTQLDSPAIDGFTVIPDDENDLSEVCRVLYVGTGGDIVVETVAGTTLTFRNFHGGYYLMIRCCKVLATGTTASNIVGLV